MKIELDYDDDLTNNIDQIIVLLTEILETASVEVEIVKDEHINWLMNDLSNNDCRLLLEEYRTDSLRDHIHVIIGSSPSSGLGNIAGRAFQYWRGVTGTGEPSYGHYTCRRLANPKKDEVDNEFLDKTGCFVFADEIIRIIDQGPAGTWDRWHGYHGALALITAHEIGHAMGITRHMEPTFPYTHVMFGLPFDSLVSNTANFYDDFNEFDEEELNHLDCIGNVFPEVKSSVNLRDLLGVHTVDIGS